MKVPKGWVECLLSDIASVFLGKTPRKEQYTSEGENKIVKFRDLKPNYLDFTNDKSGFVVNDDKLLPSLRELKIKDVLITSAAHSGENIGKKCVIANELPEKFGKIYFTGELLNIRAKNNGYLPDWIYYYFVSSEGMKEVQQAIKGVHLTSGRAKLMRIKLAPELEQRRIVLKLEQMLAKVDDCKERLEKIPVILKRFRQAVLVLAFSGEMTSEWRKQNRSIGSAEVILEEIKAYRIKNAGTKRDLSKTKKYYDERKAVFSKPQNSIELPAPWVSCFIGDLGNVCNGSTPSRKRDDFWGEGIPWVSSGEVRNNFINETREEITKKGFKNSSMRILPKGTVLLAMIGEGKTRGQSSILNIKATLNQNIAAIDIDHGLIVPEYLWFWLQHQYQSTRSAGGGSGPKALNCQRVRELPFHLAPLEEQREIVSRVNESFNLLDQIEDRYQKAKNHTDNLIQSILAKAFRGELVSQDPNDEPASELLKRIQAERAQAVAAGKPKATRKRAQVKRSPRKRESKKAVASKPEPAPAPARPARIEDLDDVAIMAAFRGVSQVQVGLPDDALIQKVSQFLGYGRLGKKIKVRLQGAMHAAKIRKIIQTEHGLIYRATLSLGDYDLRLLIKSLRAVIKKGQATEEAMVIRNAARYLGFQRVSAGMRNLLTKAIQKGVDQGLFQREKGQIRRV